MMATPLNWGILGCGQISSDFVTSLLNLSTENHKVVACAARDGNKSQKFVEDLGLEDCKSYEGYNHLLKDKAVDIIYIGTLNDTHLEWVIKACEHKKHILCEKPMGLNVKQVNHMVEAARKHKVFLMEATWSRFFPVWAGIKNIIGTKKLGDLISCNMSFGQIIQENRRDLSKGEDPLYDIGIYPIMLSLFCFGDKEPTEMHIHGEKDKNGVDKWGNITLHFEGEGHAVLYYHGGAHLKTSATLTFTNGHVHIPHSFWCPTEYELVRNPSLEELESDDVLHRDHLLKDNPEKYNYPHSAGLHYEADHVYAMIKSGRIESDIMPLQSSLLLAKVMEELRHQAKIDFPQDHGAIVNAMHKLGVVS